MKKTFRLVLQLSGIVAVVLFCVSAAAGIGTPHESVKRAFSEPVNLLLLGTAMIGFGSFVKRKTHN